MNHSRYSQYLLGLLLTILAFNFVDRLALGLTLQDIKAELRLSDTQLGLLTGIAFALFYSTAGIPIARLADRGDRVLIISITTALWSLAVASCAAATTFAQLLMIRIFVGVGEAGCMPPAHSLIADHFGRTERPRAVSIYMLGGCLSSTMGYFLAGTLNEHYGWRVTFALLGAPGIVLAILARFTLVEPRRGSVRQTGGSTPTDVEPRGSAEVRPDLWQVCRVLWRNTTFLHMATSFSVLYFFGFGVLQWQPAFFARSYGLESGVVGGWFAGIYGLGGFLGTYLGGELASRVAARNESLQLRGMAVAYSIVGVLSVFVYLSRSLYVGLALLTLISICGSAPNGPLFATIQTLIQPRMRAISIATVYLFANLVGLGLGPLVTGVFSDALRSSFGEESLRYALLVLSPGYVWGGWHLWRASRTVVRDLQTAQIEVAPGEEANDCATHINRTSQVS